MTSKMDLIVFRDKRCWIPIASYLSTRVFNFFYGVDSPVFLLDDEMELTVLRSQQGSRQGCSAGTEGFCLAIHPVLAELQMRYPDFDFRAITDDVVPIAPPPVSDSFEDWQVLYTRYAKCFSDIKDLSLLLAGLTLNAENLTCTAITSRCTTPYSSRAQAHV